MTFEDQLKMLIFYHLEEHVSARHMLQVIEQDDFARENIAPKDGIKKSNFSEAINTRGLEQLQIVFEKLSQKASGILPNRHLELRDLVALDGSLIDATLSMYWAYYRKRSLDVVSTAIPGGAAARNDELTSGRFTATASE